MSLYVESRGPHAGTPVVAVHGITANRTCWNPVADLLTDVRLHAPDLRGRGFSAELPGPWGLARHADDVAAVMAGLGSPVVLVGHSMGAFVAVLVAARRPELVRAVLLVDGGLPLQPPPGMSAEQAIQASLGPSLQRLGMSFADRGAYRNFWRRHPALGPYWSPAVEVYVDADLTGTPPHLRSRVRADAVTQDSAELFERAAVDAALAAVQVPTILLTAPRGLLDGPPLYDASALTAAREVRPDLDVREVADVNHYTIVLGSGASTVAVAVRELADVR